MKLLARILVWLAGTAVGAAQAQNYSDLWWNPSESGWGLTIAHHNDQMFVVLFIYDQSGNPTWVTIPGGTFTLDKRTFSGDVYRTTATPLGQTWNPSAVVNTKVGNATLIFQDDARATLTYSVNGSLVTKSIVRQSFGPMTPSYPFDSTDLWWNPQESGWGFAVIEQGNVSFSVLYAHDAGGQPTWYAGPRAERAFVGGAQKWLQWRWPVFKTKGTPFDRPWNTADLRVNPYEDNCELPIFYMEIPMNVPGADAELSYQGCGKQLWSGVRFLRRMSFGTAASVPNHVVHAYPNPGSTNAYAGTRVLARFGAPLREPIIGSTGSKGIFVFDGTTPVSGGVYYRSHYGSEADDIAHTIEFYPDVPFVPGRTYRAQIVGQISADGRVADPYEWTFTMRGAEDYRSSPFLILGTGFYAASGLGTASQRVVPVGNDSLRPGIAWPIQARGVIATANDIVFSGSWVQQLKSGGGVINPGSGAYFGLGLIDRYTMLPKMVWLPSTSSDLHGNMSCLDDRSKCYLVFANFPKNQGWIEEVDIASGTVTRRLERADQTSIFKNIGALTVAGNRLYALMTGLYVYDKYELVAFDLTTGKESAKWTLDGTSGQMAASSANGGRVWIVVSRPSSAPNPGMRLVMLDGATLQVRRDVSISDFSGDELVAIPGTSSFVFAAQGGLAVVDGESLQVVQVMASERKFRRLCFERSGQRGWAISRPFPGETNFGVMQISLSGERITSLAGPIPIERSDLETFPMDSTPYGIACLQ